MLGNDFSSANTSPNLNFAPPSKTKQNTKLECILLHVQTEPALIYHLSPGSTSEKKQRKFLCCAHCFFSQTQQ